MLQGQNLRRADFITSLILIVFSVWMLVETFQMPMQDSYGGVQNVWYVSPALFPLLIAIALFFLGCTLLYHSIQQGGARYFFSTIKKIQWRISDKTYRFLVILLSLGTFVYLYIPRVDFFITLFLFLVFFITVFYLDHSALIKKLVWFYLVGSTCFLLLFATGLHPLLIRLSKYSIDFLALLFAVGFVIYTKIHMGNHALSRKKFRTVVFISILVPLVLCPVFRYLLLVPLPQEGLIIDWMNWIRYALR